MTYLPLWSLLPIAVLAAIPARGEPFSIRLESATPEQTCGAALVASGGIVTAGHCLASNVRQGRMIREPGGDGTVPIRQSARHPVYDTAPPSLSRFAYDLTLAGLGAASEPISGVAVLPIGAPPVSGEVLVVETWLRTDDAPSQRDCPVLDAFPLVVLDCPVVSGHSGAPVVRITASGAELVAIVVASQNGGRENRARALAASVAPRIGALLETFGAL